MMVLPVNNNTMLEKKDEDSVTPLQKPLNLPRKPVWPPAPIDQKVVPEKTAPPLKPSELNLSRRKTVKELASSQDIKIVFSKPPVTAKSDPKTSPSPADTTEIQPVVPTRVPPVPMPRKASTSSNDSVGTPTTPVPLPRTIFNVVSNTNNVACQLGRSSSMPLSSSPFSNSNKTSESRRKPELSHSVSHPTKWLNLKSPPQSPSSLPPVPENPAAAIPMATEDRVGDVPSLTTADDNEEVSAITWL